MRVYGAVDGMAREESTPLLRKPARNVAMTMSKIAIVACGIVLIGTVAVTSSFKSTKMQLGYVDDDGKLGHHEHHSSAKVAEDVDVVADTEKYNDNIEDTVDDAQEDIQEAFEQVQDALELAGNQTQDALENASEQAEDAISNITGGNFPPNVTHTDITLPNNATISVPVINLPGANSSTNSSTDPDVVIDAPPATNVTDSSETTDAAPQQHHHHHSNVTNVTASGEVPADAPPAPDCNHDGKPDSCEEIETSNSTSTEEVPAEVPDCHNDGKPDS